MKEKKQNIKTIIAVITFTVFLIYFLQNMSFIVKALGKILRLILPFIIGCGIAFVLNIPMRNIESKLFKNKEGRLYGSRRAISMIITYALAVLVVALVLFVVVPEVGNTVGKIQDQFEPFVDNVKSWALEKAEGHEDLEKEIEKFDPDISDITGIFFDNGATILQTTVNIFSSVISAFINIIVGIVFSIYILSRKELLGKQVKMLIYAVFKEGTADEMMIFGKIANNTFSKFFYCQFREGLILGTMFAVAMAIFGLPYPLTIGVLIAFTALIPVFGAFIGLFIGAFLILVDTPSMVIWFVILFFSLQCIENYFIYPKLVGGGVGLSPIWVLLAVLVGGDLMGVVGMIVFIPLVSVAYAYLRSIVYRKLKHKNINVDDKQAPDDVMPLMEERRRLFARKARQQKLSDIPVVNETDMESGDNEDVKS
ncbi:MAG: AI-2E family transporter [Wujia sp.]